MARRIKLKTFDTGVFDNFTEETFDRFEIRAKNKINAIKQTKKKFGINAFKNKNLRVDVV